MTSPRCPPQLGLVTAAVVGGVAYLYKDKQRRNSVGVPLVPAKSSVEQARADLERVSGRTRDTGREAIEAAKDLGSAAKDAVKTVERKIKA
jgi:hypothetical protein